MSRSLTGGEVFPGQAEFFEQRSLVVGQKDIRRAHETDQRLASFGPSQVQRDTFLVAAGENPAPIEFGLGRAGELRKEPPQVAAAGALDFDHLGAKVGHDGGGRGAGNVGSAIDNPEARKQTAVIVVVRVRACCVTPNQRRLKNRDRQSRCSTENQASQGAKRFSGTRRGARGTGREPTLVSSRSHPPGCQSTVLRGQVEFLRTLRAFARFALSHSTAFDHEHGGVARIRSRPGFVARSKRHFQRPDAAVLE